MSNTNMTPSEFAKLLDVYGGNRMCWPPEARAAAAHLIARDAGARRLLAEAEALDRVLERAPAPALAKEAALADRIVAAAQRSPRIVSIAGARPVAVASAPSETAAGLVAMRNSRLRSRLLSGEAGAVGFLVASLMVGVVIGHSNLPQQLLPTLAEITGLAPDRNNLTQIALSHEDMQ